MRNKWKVLAVSHFFSHNATDEQQVALYDALQACNTSPEVESAIRKAEAIVWEPFENSVDRHFPKLLDALAAHAQHLEGDIL